ncbi:hypothetical protein THASP1DRAFT_26721, partial [Thamnocephalis sphaerospora]
MTNPSLAAQPASPAAPEGTAQQHAPPNQAQAIAVDSCIDGNWHAPNSPFCSIYERCHAGRSGENTDDNKCGTIFAVEDSNAKFPSDNDLQANDIKIVSINDSYESDTSTASSHGADEETARICKGANAWKRKHRDFKDNHYIERDVAKVAKGELAPFHANERELNAVRYQMELLCDDNFKDSWSFCNECEVKKDICNKGDVSSSKIGAKILRRDRPHYGFGYGSGSLQDVQKCLESANFIARGSLVSMRTGVIRAVKVSAHILDEKGLPWIARAVDNDGQKLVVKVFTDIRNGNHEAIMYGRVLCTNPRLDGRIAKVIHSFLCGRHPVLVMKEEQEASQPVSTEMQLARLAQEVAT